MNWVALVLGVLATWAVVQVLYRWHARREQREHERLRAKVARILDERRAGRT